MNEAETRAEYIDPAFSESDIIQANSVPIANSGLNSSKIMLRSYSGRKGVGIAYENCAFLI